MLVSDFPSWLSFCFIKSIKKKLFLHLNCLIIDIIWNFERPIISETSRIRNFWTRDKYIASFIASVNSYWFSSSSSCIGEAEDLSICIFNKMNFCDNTFVQTILFAAINYTNQRILIALNWVFCWLADSDLFFEGIQADKFEFLSNIRNEIICFLHIALNQLCLIIIQ